MSDNHTSDTDGSSQDGLGDQRDSQSEQGENRVFNCPARCQGPDHSGAVLRFVSESFRFQHGAELRCTFPNCYSPARRFLWCARCARPYNRRNFKKQHAHSGSLDAQDMMLTSSGAGIEQPSSGGSEPDANASIECRVAKLENSMGRLLSL